MGTAAAPPKRYVWDEFDDGEEANHQPPARRRSQPSAKYAWDDEEAPALADGDASFEAARAQIRRLQAQLAEAKDVVRKRRVELRQTREDAKAGLARCREEWRRKQAAADADFKRKAAEQAALKARLEDDVAELERRVEQLRAHAAKADAVKSAKVAAAEREAEKKLEAAKREWKRREEEEFAALVEKRKPAIKAKVVKALEPEVRRLISRNKKELAEHKAEDDRWLDE